MSPGTAGGNRNKLQDHVHSSGQMDTTSCMINEYSKQIQRCYLHPEQKKNQIHTRSTPFNVKWYKMEQLSGGANDSFKWIFT